MEAGGLPGHHRKNGFLLQQVHLLHLRHQPDERLLLQQRRQVPDQGGEQQQDLRYRPHGQRCACGQREDPGHRRPLCGKRCTGKEGQLPDHQRRQHRLMGGWRRRLGSGKRQNQPGHPQRQPDLDLRQQDRERQLRRGGRPGQDHRHDRPGESGIPGQAHQ